VKKLAALIWIVTVVATLLSSAPAHAQDVREAARQAAADRAAALDRARAAEEAILGDRGKLLAEVERLEAQQKALESDVAGLEAAIVAGDKRHEKLTDEWSQKELEFREISGNVRVVARDVETLLIQSPFSAVDPSRIDAVAPLLEQGYFPDINDISGMARAVFDEIHRSGQVGFIESSYVGRDGEDRRGRVLTLGKFTSIYRDGDEAGFLSYSPESRRFFALSQLPSGGMARAMKKYTSGEGAVVPVDISGGAALRHITQQTSIVDQLKSGGPIVIPILAIALAVLVIVVTKFIFLNRVHGNTDKFMNEVNDLAARGEWGKCKEIVNSHKGKNWPVINVIRDGLRARREDRETLESVLQESILRELPRLEKGLAVLAVFGAVAPLLGLLGTVTGMIDTFRVITLFGTGDPKLMSGGISEALVTTEVGLAVAIPTMLFHTFLSRRVNTIVGDMEEKAVTMTNIIQKEQKQNGSLVASA
jgi:biopolymer transport protein ExbB